MRFHKVAAVTISFALLGAVLTTPDVRAQSLADYTAEPTFISDRVKPNILLLLDNSGSMNELAYQSAFDPTKTYLGLFEAAECYRYESSGTARFVPDPAANPSSMPVGGWTCTGNVTYEYSGNLMNYASMRRIDVTKLVLTGGMCATRDATGACTDHVSAQTAFDLGACCEDQSQSISNTNLVGRMPAGEMGGSTTYFHLKASEASLQGYLCIDANSSTSTCTSGNEYKRRLRGDASSIHSGIVQSVQDTARMGVMVFNWYEGAKVTAPVAAGVNAVLTGVDNAFGESATPIGESLYEAARYFAQLSPAFTPCCSGPETVDYANARNTDDPYYFTAPKWAAADAFVPCCESYVIIFTDGEPTNDTNIPSALDDYYSTSNGILDDVAYWAHTSDLRQATVPVIGGTGSDLTGTQNLTVYTFFAFGSGSALLKESAKVGGFQDIDGDGAGPGGRNTPNLQDEWDQVNNDTGAQGQDGIPDTYFESSDAGLLKDRLLATISSILQRSGSGSAASVLASSSTGEGAVYQSYFYPTTVEGLKDVKWTGHTQGLFIDVFGNLREDSNGDGRLIYADDKIVRMTFDTTTEQVVVERFADTSPADGLADSTTPVGGAVELRNVQGIWEAGKRLALTDPANRNIITWIDKDNDGLVDGGEQVDFTTANVGVLSPYLRPGAAPFTADNIVRFIRGEQPAGLRNRQLTVNGNLKVWKMGDPIHARPIVVGSPTQRYDLIYGDITYTAFLKKYQNRRQVAYVGGNDGMLHAFNAGFYRRGDDPNTGEVEHGCFTETAGANCSSTPKVLGNELFGFIPQELLPHLIWLTRPDYTHVYYVDLTPKVTEARIFTPDADHPDGWGTILMGGFRLGGSCGSCPAGNGLPMTVNDDFNYDLDTSDPDDTRTFYSAYFVLDITNPESASYPKLLWSFSNSTLGFTTTTPSMLRVSPASSSVTDNTDAKWYMVMGSGPTGYDGRITQSGKLYAMDLKTGVTTTMTADTDADAANLFLADPVTVDRDFDYRVDAAYMGGVFYDGSLPWHGKLYRLAMNSCAAAPCTPGNWGIADGANRQATDLLKTFPTSGATQLGPVTAGVAVAVDDSNKLWVFGGTGRYFDAIDKSSTA